MLFLLQERLNYAAISYAPKHSKRGSLDPPTSTGRTISPYPIWTHSSGSLAGGDGVNNRANQSGTLVAVDPHSRCIAVHAFEGLLTIIPVDQKYRMPVFGKQDSDDNNISVQRTRSLLSSPFHCRLEEHTVLSITFLSTPDAAPMLAILYQDARGAQHVITHVVDIGKKQLHLYGSSSQSSVQWIKRSSVDGGSSMIIPVKVDPAPAVASAMEETPQAPSNGVIVVGQRQITYCAPSLSKVIPITPALYIAYTVIPAGDGPRFLLADELGNIHMLMVMVVSGRVVGMQMEALGSCTIASGIVYLDKGLIFVGSSFNDSQLIQIHDEPITADENDVLMDNTYLEVLDEYTNLGPIPDFDLVPTAPTLTDDQHVQSQVVTASGFSKLGSIRVVRNGIGMNEYASVEIPGIQAMWNLRKTWSSKEDGYLVQSFVGETRVLGAVVAEAMEEGNVGGLEEVVLPGLDPDSTTLYVGNVFPGDRLLQITDSQVRLFSQEGEVLSTWDGLVTVASANEAGQVALVSQSGIVDYFEIADDQIHLRSEHKMKEEISCIDIRPFSDRKTSGASSSMDVDGPARSKLVAIGLWDECTVRLLSIDDGLKLESCVVIDLSSGDDEDPGEGDPSSQPRCRRGASMARSLCMATLEFPSSAATGIMSEGVDMLFVGLGDGILISFVVTMKDGSPKCQSKKEVCLGTQRIDLVPLKSEGGGSCMLITGDRPTVVYIASAGSSFADRINPKLCYSTVNVAEEDDDDDETVSRPPSKDCTVVNVAAPFFSSLLFDTASFGSQHYSLCVANDESLRLGVIDDIQKLHVTTVRLGMSPRRIAHCHDARSFAIGCVESGIQNFGFGNEESNAMGNCLMIMDDNTFEKIEQIDLEPFEMLLSLAYVSLALPNCGDLVNFLAVGTAYALADEDEPNRGRVLLYSLKLEDSGQALKREVKQVTELTVEGGAYSMCQFYKGSILVSVNTRTHMCKLVEESGILRLQLIGVGHFGHILSLQVKSCASRKRPTVLAVAQAANAIPAEDAEDDQQEMTAVVGDFMRSMSLIQYYPQHQILEEIARDFNTNWITAIEMITDNVYLGAENFSNLYCLRRNTSDSPEEIRCRLDTVGEFHLGQMVNKFMKGSLIMPVTSSSKNISRRSRRRVPSSPTGKQMDSPGAKPVKSFRPRVAVGSETVFVTVDGGIGMVLGLDVATAAFFTTLERSMSTVIEHVGNFSHQEHRSFQGERRSHPSHGFVDGDLVEYFLELDRDGMELVVKEMNRDGRWDVEDADMFTNPENISEGKRSLDLEVEDVLAMVEEMIMLH